MNEALEEAMVDLRDLHDMTVRHIQNLEKTTRSHVDAFHRMKHQIEEDHEHLMLDRSE